MAEQRGTTEGSNAGPDGSATAAPVPMTVFRSFEPDEFLEWPTWQRLLRILRSNGGSYGLSGPRGSGKSWLMLRAIEWVRSANDAGQLGGIGLWYPTPSEYKPLDFLASLSDSLGTEIDRWYRRNPLIQARRNVFRWAGPVWALIVAGVMLASFLLFAPGGSAVVTGVVTVIAGLIGGLLARELSSERRGLYAREAALAKEAKIVSERARYTATRRDSYEFGAEGGRGFLARFRALRERELVERPATLSSLVNDFRALAGEAGEVAGRVVIAIDELDKMEDAKGVRDLLRDIKGIFEVPRVHFLVSVSNEAARSLSLGALEGRNEFNSSFYTVLEVPPAEPEDLAELIDRRTGGTVSREVALVLAVLSGGNAREVLRLAELAGDSKSPAEATAKALQDETLRLRREIVTAPDVEGREPLSNEARVRAFEALPDSAFSTPDALLTLGRSALDNWDTQWARDDAGFRTRFGEAWRRSMVRLAVAAELLEAQSLVRDEALTTRLRDVIVAASQSAHVGRVVLEGQLQVEAARPRLDEGSARLRLRSLAAQYEEIRESLPSGDERTELMETIAAEARAVARDANFQVSDLRAMLGSDGRPGDRLVALAAIETTGDPAVFAALAQTLESPLTAFEGYHALRALEALLPSLDEGQVAEVRALLLAQVEELVDRDPDRGALAKRILDWSYRRAFTSKLA
jgi:hypothetical protein